MGGFWRFLDNGRILIVFEQKERCGWKRLSAKYLTKIFGWSHFIARGYFFKEKRSVSRREVTQYTVQSGAAAPRYSSYRPTTKQAILSRKRKVRVGIEPTNKSFADSRLTTWPPHRNKIKLYLYYSKNRFSLHALENQTSKNPPAREIGHKRRETVSSWSITFK